MAATFSINLGSTTESTRKTDLPSVLNDLNDNTQKQITPRDVRDAFLSTWANTPFKVTTPNALSSYEYIGIDSSNPSDKDIKKKILLGKRSFGGLDIMNSTLLNTTNTPDIYIYNTKPDTATQSTKVAILAGTTSISHLNAPYFEALQTGDFNITNPAPNGAINILSTSGRVAVNGIVFPTQLETASASTGKILRYSGNYPTGSLKWVEPTITLTTIGDTSSNTNIYGSTISVNGYPLEFIDDNLTPNEIGGIPSGFSFSSDSFVGQNWPIVEVIRKILYPYKAPELELNIDPLYAEIGTTPSITLDWKITTYARNEDEKICSFQITNTPITGLSYSGLPGTYTASSVIISTFSATSTTKNWVLNVSDSGLLNFFTYSATASLSFINPVFYGFSTYSTINSALTFLSKEITPYPGSSQSVDLNYNGYGYLYFVNNFGYSPSKIKDHNGFILYDAINATYSSFTYSSTTLPGYTGSFQVWRTKHICSITNSEFKIIF